MRQIETRIVIMVTNRLAAAADSEAKTEMIEELSENLYQRYLDLAEEGMPQEEALEKAMESLGDVDELLAFLEVGKRDSHPQEVQQENFSKDSAPEENDSSFSKGDFEKGLEDIVNAALSTAKVAVGCARDVAKDVSDQIKEKYPDGVFKNFSAGGYRKVEDMSIPAEEICSLEITLTNGSVVLKKGEDESFIEVTGDTEEIELMLMEDGVLAISQGNTASAAYFFVRGMRRSDIEVTLPGKLWKKIAVSTVNGAVSVKEGLACETFRASTSSGNLELTGISAKQITLRSASGSIAGENLNGDIRGETKSGDIKLENAHGHCELFSASGDIVYQGEAEVNASSTSGDVRLCFEKIPRKVRGNSISGNCEVQVAEGEGFHFSYRTVSGRFMTNLPLQGNLGKEQGEAVYGSEAKGHVQLSSVSGDIELSTDRP